MFEFNCSKYDYHLIYSEIPMLSTHPRLWSRSMFPKSQYIFSMKTSGLNLCIRAGNSPHRVTESSGTRDYSGSLSISVSKILDRIQQNFMVVAEKLFCSVFPTTGSRANFSIQSGEIEYKLDIRSALITSENLDHRPS